MILSRKHADHAVAAKARRRMNPPVFPDVAPARDPAPPRRGRAVVTLQVRCHERGDSLTLNLHRSPWRNLWLCDLGRFSSAHLGRAVAEILKANA